MEATFMKTALEEAVAWYARLQAPDCQPEERTRFIRWLAQDEEHTRVYASVERFVRDLDARAPLDPELRALADAALIVEDESPALAHFHAAWKRHLVPLAAAACIVAGFFLAPALRDFAAKPADMLAFATPAGEQRLLTLTDGTLTSLDSDSALTVQMSAQARAIELVKGRALFEVAHDAQRPFSVVVGATRVTALGTRFQVQRQDKLVVVTLEEGSVDVVSELDGRTLRERLQPGEQLRFEQDSATWLKASVETDTVTSWSRGRHVFRNARLGDALEEVNRYAQPKVRLDDPALADLTVSGNFVIGDSALILSAFEAALPVRVVDGGNELVLFPAYETRAQ
jgi:transmembrane sensor